MKRILTVALFAWYVCTWSGQPVAGPFTLLNDCEAVAKVMASQSYNISTICRFKN